MRRRLTAAALAASVLLAPLLLSGCAVFGFLYNKITPPPKVPAAFRLPRDRTVLVLVDDVQHPVSHFEVKRRLTDQINQHLAKHTDVKELVPYQDVLTFVSATPDFYRLEVREIGKRLEADVVVYVNIVDFSLRDPQAPQLWRGSLAARVLVKDVERGTLWPKDHPQGALLAPATTPQETNADPGYDQTLARQLADDLADRVAKLFYKHEAAPN